MNTLMKFGRFLAEASTEIVPMETIVTGYGDTKVPAITIIVLALSVVLLIAFGVAAFIIMKNRTFGWQQPLLIGAVAYLLFTSLLYMGALLGITAIPAVRNYFDAHIELYNLISILWAIVMDICAMYFGYKYIVSRMEKRNERINLAVPIGMGVAFYIIGVIASSELSNFLYYTMYAFNINSAGFDPLVTSMVGQGADLQEAVEAVYGFATQNPLLFLLDALSYVFKAVVETSGLIAIYGVLTEKLEKKWLIFGIGIIVVYFIPNFLASFTESPIWLRLVLVLIIVAGAVYTAIYLVKKYMPEDVNMLSHSIAKNKDYNRRNKQQPPKMPKIVMPD